MIVHCTLLSLLKNESWSNDTLFDIPSWKIISSDTLTGASIATGAILRSLSFYDEVIDDIFYNAIDDDVYFNAFIMLQTGVRTHRQ
jgi:hypothetical protein